MSQVMLHLPDRLLPSLSNMISQLSHSFLAKYQDAIVPFGPVGEITFKRTYARPVVENGVKRRETWIETQTRVINGLLELVPGVLTEAEAEEMFDFNFFLKTCPSGRSLWQLGTETVRRHGAASLNACWQVPISSLDSFCFIFDMMMLGGGVGLNIQREHVYQLPKLREKVPTISHEKGFGADFIVPDSREGWVELLWKVLNQYFDTGTQLGYLPGKTTFSFSTDAVRSKGTPIKGFGGVASGPNALIEGITNICGILDRRIGKRLRPIDAMDIVNLIGSIVVSGNVRRAAEIVLGDTDDFQFLDAKRWDRGNIPNWRAMSNNTVVANKYEHLQDKFWEGYEGNGEPYGLFNLGLCQTRGRLIDGYVDDTGVTGTNPCGEASLSPFEGCNLSEIFAPNIEDIDELKRAARSVYRMTKMISAAPTHWPQSQAIIERNMRLGNGLTGIFQALDLLTDENMDAVYTDIRAYDVAFSKRMSKVLGRHIPPSIKLTVVKPSGTVSLLAGVSPGVHPEFADYFIRRIRMASNDPLVEQCRKMYNVEYVRRFDGTADHDTVAVEFPIKARPGRTAPEVSALEQLELAQRLQTYWADQQVSCTVYYELAELPIIQDWLENNYDEGVKGISFLLKTEHGFAQPPIEPITEELFLQMLEGRTKNRDQHLDFSADSGEDLEVGSCAGNVCPIK